MQSPLWHQYVNWFQQRPLFTPVFGANAGTKTPAGDPRRTCRRLYGLRLDAVSGVPEVNRTLQSALNSDQSWLGVLWPAKSSVDSGSGNPSGLAGQSLPSLKLLLARVSLSD